MHEDTDFNGGWAVYFATLPYFWKQNTSIYVNNNDNKDIVHCKVYYFQQCI